MGELNFREDLPFPNDLARAIELFGSGLVNDFGEFPPVDGFDLFVATFQLFERLDRSFRHALVGFLRAADQGKFFTLSNAFVAVFIVQSDAQ